LQATTSNVDKFPSYAGRMPAASLRSFYRKILWSLQKTLINSVNRTDLDCKHRPGLFDISRRHTRCRRYFSYNQISNFIRLPTSLSCKPHT